ncbi:uncharacterized protein LODBEIA_P08370 [Lodderomyces beijingensis]|uniref:Cysteine protease n=1 Tax=Lodderomyces beijingensis TaxID=1775926 RepID=A0ABP0ZEM1_9ASCO
MEPSSAASSDNEAVEAPALAPSSSDGEVADSVFGRFSALMKEITGTSTDTKEASTSTSPAPASSESNVFKEENEPKQQQADLKPRTYVVLGEKFDSAHAAKERIQRLLWLSYRCGFEPIPKSEDGPQPIAFFPSIVFSRSTLSNLNNLKSLLDKEHFTSDAGWGCMIRTSQNLLANALLKLNLAAGEAHTQEKIIDLFQDNSQARFSLHNYIDAVSGEPLNIEPGQWFGPNAASLSMKRLTEKMHVGNTKAAEVTIPFVYVSENCDLYDDEIEGLFVKEKRPLLLLFPIRLGIDQVNRYYYSSILQLLSSRFSVGIAGGKPSSSFYFIGYEEDDELIYFDPHLPQVVESPCRMESYHTADYSKLKISMLDPSMMIGVLLESMKEYQHFKLECSAAKNKILHFHPLVTTAAQESSINQSWEEVQGEEDFVNLSVVKNEEEFIDLGK